MSDTPEPIPRMTKIAEELEDLVEAFYEELEKKGDTQEDALRGKHRELTDKLLWVSGHRVVAEERAEKLLASFLYDQYTQALGAQAVTLRSYLRSHVV